ncbi:tRNA(Arg) A34 adenosine deaminase TadA [Kineosphaera limosa]|uniref:Putative deaminase n=1 Tax=Kineosphaera limosa NBRC 100340 TaxID=1184609 RepID=K6WPH9_9MICO|nr:nucleoside deaminase [Kineosphaera limosa]NYE00095.1 tRNA(Arg) A34 adenosine deaminase TadA [Kineosphaera limosa]GAB95731.1 putative deaminase [Kineosphaera limosa NBRC 100340]
MSLSPVDLQHLNRAVDLAEQALRAGDEPFGSLLVDADGRVLLQDHNRVVSRDGTRHPEFRLARWAGGHLSPQQRAAATVYTSGEHCPMCAAAHGWVGLGRIVYAASALQFAQWQQEWGAPDAPVAPLPITSVVPDAEVDGPAPQLADRVRALHRRFFDEVASSRGR